MSDEVEIPEVCKKYDVLSDEITDLESQEESLQNDNQELITELKEDIEAVKNAIEIGEDSEYLRKRIKEIDLKLLENDETIKKIQENIQVYYNEQNEVKKEIEIIKWWKIKPTLIGPSKWCPEEEAKDKIHPFGWCRIV